MIGMKDLQRANWWKGSFPFQLFLPLDKESNTKKSKLKDGMTDTVKSEQG